MEEEGKGCAVEAQCGVETGQSSAEDGGERAYRQPGAPEDAPGLAPLDFSGFVFGLGQMALVHLGELPDPNGGQRAEDMDQARHMIDILDLLEQKTRGNLNEEEAGLLRYLLSDLKLRYVRLAK